MCSASWRLRERPPRPPLQPEHQRLHFFLVKIYRQYNFASASWKILQNGERSVSLRSSSNMAVCRAGVQAHHTEKKTTKPLLQLQKFFLFLLRPKKWWHAVRFLGKEHKTLPCASRMCGSLRQRLSRQSNFRPGICSVSPKKKMGWGSREKREMKN